MRGGHTPEYEAKAVCPVRDEPQYGSTLTIEVYDIIVQLPPREGMGYTCNGRVSEATRLFAPRTRGIHRIAK